MTRYFGSKFLDTGGRSWVRSYLLLPTLFRNKLIFGQFPIKATPVGRIPLFIKLSHLLFILSKLHVFIFFLYLNTSSWTRGIFSAKLHTFPYTYRKNFKKCKWINQTSLIKTSNNWTGWNILSIKKFFDHVTSKKMLRMYFANYEEK